MSVHLQCGHKGSHLLKCSRIPGVYVLKVKSCNAISNINTSIVVLAFLYVRTYSINYTEHVNSNNETFLRLFQSL